MTLHPALQELIRRLEVYDRAWDCLDEAKVALAMVDPPEDQQVDWARCLTRIATTKNALAKMGARREPNKDPGPQIPMEGISDGAPGADPPADAATAAPS